jgi:hypothetical protein
MNIFVLDLDTDRCARFHTDRHVVKMVLETAQILCTVLYSIGIEAPYRPTHHRHPCVLWAGESLSNWVWLRKLGTSLDREYRYRFRSDVSHASGTVISSLRRPQLPDMGLTGFAQAMPPELRIPGDPVAAYRRYYALEKTAGARWTRRRIPTWIRSSVEETRETKGRREAGG